jgi:hypothetical protein
MYENLIIGVDGRQGGLDALVGDLDVPLIVTASVDSTAVARWQERHREAGAYGTR